MVYNKEEQRSQNYWMTGKVKGNLPFNKKEPKMALVSVFGRAVGANEYKNNSATVLFGGNIDSSPTVTTAPWLGVGTEDPTRTKIGSKVPAATATSGTKLAIGNGLFASQVAGKYVIRAGNQNTLAGVTYAALLIPSNAIATHRKTAVRGRKYVRTIIISSWDYATGTPTYTQTGSTPDTVYGTTGDTTYADMRQADEETRRTMAIPGELTLIEAGEQVPTNFDYPARTNG